MLAGLTPQILASFSTVGFFFYAMKKYRLLKKIIIKRPIVFLCGPYYNKKSDGDRRKILKEYFINKKKACLPLIIDDILTADKIQDPTINIQLMEEIFAAVSYRTYIFLDTVSTATELGIFANSAYSNSLKIYLPKYDDIYNKSNVGYFVRKGVLRENSKLIDVLEYRPQIQRKAIATDYIVEYYGFVNNELPENLKTDIDNDKDLGKQEDFSIDIKNSDSRPENYNQICYFDNGSSLHVKTSLKLLFYTTLAVVYSEYYDFFVRKDNDFSKIDISIVTKIVKDAYVNLIATSHLIGVYRDADIRIETALNLEHIEELIRHIVKFLHLFNTASDYKNTYLFTNPEGVIIETLDNKKYLSEILPLSCDQIKLLNLIIYEPEKYYEKVTINKGKKKREIIKYREGQGGEAARKLHEYIADTFSKKYIHNVASFAYHKNMGIKECVAKHVSSNSFVKFDIRKFFNSITIKVAEKALIREFNITEKNSELVKIVLSTCFFENVMPLGLVMSPIISDIVMKQFDEKLVYYARENNLIYTRYADDIMLSSSKYITNEMYNNIESNVKSELKKLGLKLNEDKTQVVSFDNNHSFIKYIGVAIIKGTKVNYLSVGKDYIYETAKEYLEYQQKYAELEDDSEDKFYAKKRLIGKISYIRHIEGNHGINRLKRRLSKYVDSQSNPDLII